MAETWRWENLYQARDLKGFWYEMAGLADLYVSDIGLVNGHGEYRRLLNGSNVVPYAVMMRSHGHDPRRDPRWAELFALYPAPAKQQLVELGIATKDPTTGEITAKDGFWTRPESEYMAYQGYSEYYRGPQGNSYWTDDEVQEEINRNQAYAGDYKDAVSWWMLLHGLNPDAITPYHEEVKRTLQQINMVEAGDPTMALILSTTEPAAPDPQLVTASPYAAPRTPTTTQASMIPLDMIKKYWMYLAAGGLAIYLYQKRKTT